MGIFDGCLLACDVDDTLVENGYINPRNVEKIKYFVKEGGKFCLCTGRSIGAVQCVLRQIDCISYTVAANGCMVYDHGKNEILNQEYLPETDYGIANELCMNFPFLGAEIHSGENVLTLNRTLESDIHQKYEELPTNCIDFKSACEYNWNKVIYMLENDSQYQDLMNFLEKIDVKSTFIKTSVVINGVFRNYYEQLPPGVSKNTGLKKLCKILDIKKGRLFAIGDYYNDFEMINNADIGAATADAPDEIKQSAEYVTCKCIDGAVADFIDYLTSEKTERVENMEAITKKELQITAAKVRMGIIEGIHAAKAGHPGGSLSCTDILTYLYFNHMNIDPKDPKKADRDRFVLSKGHAAPALYSVLAHRGFFDVEMLKTLRQPGSILQGHPDMKYIPGVDMSTGSLGQGISAAAGMALSSKHFGDNYKVYAVLGDGELEEGQVWEAAMFASNKKLSNLTAFVDYNGLQIDGSIEEVNSPAPIDAKFEAFGWHTIIIDGNDFDEIEKALAEAETVDKPVAIIAKTVKGKGVSYMENAVNWHGAAPNDELFEQAMTELKANLAKLEA